MVKLYINKTRVAVPEGTSVFNAARQAEIAIPHLCYHPMLSVSGACRLCVVEIEGRDDLPASCTTSVAEDMVVWTESERVIRARKVVLSLYLANHPNDCLTCEKTGDCRLQDYAYLYGVQKPYYQGGARKDYPIEDTNPCFERDHNKCILCGRCVLMCDEVVGVHAYDFGYRSADAKIVAGMDMGLEDSACIFCGNCITVCPVGALMPKWGQGKGRAFDVRRVETLCPYCGVGCRLFLHVNHGQVVGMSPAAGPANHNLLCVKGRFGLDFIHHPDRLKRPLVRRDGRLQEASWEEALDLVAAKFTAIKDRYGPDAIAGISSAKATNEENYLMQKFMRAVIGTNNVDNSARLCHASTLTGLARAFGSGSMTNTIAELEDADVIFVIGSNTSEAHPVIGFWVKKAEKKGAKLIVADPREIDMAVDADLHLRHLPGTDAALLNGMMYVILEEGLWDREFVEQRTKNFAAFRERVKRYDPERVSRITGVQPELIRKAAGLYGGADRATILYAMGITQHTTGTLNVYQIANLAMLTGNVGRRSTGVYPLRGQNNVQGACDMGALPGYLPGYQRPDNAEVREKFERAWGRPLPEREGLSVVEMVKAALAGSVKAMYIVGENPMLSNPNVNECRLALERLEFLVVQDIFLTETARLADVVLPAASFAEKDGTFTNTERRVQLLRKAIPPVGEARPDWEIICDISRRMGYPMEYGSTEEIMAEIAEVTPIYGGIYHDRLGDAGLQWPCYDRDHPGTTFLHHERFAGGLGEFVPVEDRAPEELPDEEYPFVLMTGRILYHFHTGSMSRRSQALDALRPDGYVEINPEAAARLGIEEGEELVISSRRGRITIKALLTKQVHPRAVFIPFHFAEAAANVLTNDALDPEADIPELKVCAVRIEKSAHGDPRRSPVS